MTGGKTEIEVRPAVLGDIPAINDLYNRFVSETAITFDVVPSTLQAREEWFRQFSTSGPYQLFTAEAGGTFAGYVGSLRFRPKEAYRTSIETTIYVDPAFQGRGVGHALYEALFAALAQTDIHRAYAGIALPNEPSIRLHESAGFRHIGTYNEVGFKLGRYWDVAWYERPIG